MTIQHVWFDSSLIHNDRTKRTDLILLKIATTDSSPTNDEKCGICGGVPIDESTLNATGTDKSDGSMDQNFMGEITVGSFNMISDSYLYI